MNEERWGIIYCPRKETFTTAKRRWEQIEKSLQRHGIVYDHVQSEQKASVSRLVKMMVNNGYQTIVLVGGDSALNDAVNVLMAEERQVRERIALGVIPNGVMNDFAHFWGFQEDKVDQTIQWLKQRRVRNIDLGCLRYKNKEGEACRRYFLNCVDVGIVADIMQMRRQARHFAGARPLSYAASFMWMTLRRLDYPMRVRINEDYLKRRVMTLCVGNSTGYGQTPSAVPYNGLLDVSVVTPPRTSQLMQGFYLLMRGRLLNHRSVHPYRTHEVVFEEIGHAPVSVDGRMMRHPVGSFRVTVEQEVVKFLIPAY